MSTDFFRINRAKSPYDEALPDGVRCAVLDPIPSCLIPNRAVPSADDAPFLRGVYYEGIACRFLEKNLGFRILERNFRVGKAELDAIAKRRDLLVFAEIKARRIGSDFETRLNLDAHKLREISYAADGYLRDLCLHGIDPDALRIRFDLICVFFDGNGVARTLRHYPGFAERADETVRSSL